VSLSFLALVVEKAKLIGLTVGFKVCDRNANLPAASKNDREVVHGRESI
jgi:hypothetical protein